MAGHSKRFVFFGICLIHAQIFAQSPKANQIFENLNDQFSAKSSAKDHQLGEVFLLFVAGAVLAFVIWLAYQLYVQRKQSLSPDSAWGLYQKLCQVHHLSFKERSVIRKVCRWNGLEDPLPLFVEPKYFKQILADETMFRFHEVVQELLSKLFSHGQELSQESIEVNGESTEEKRNDNPMENGQVLLANHEAIRNVEYQVDHTVADFPPATLEWSPASSLLEKPSPPMTKVLLNPIPGRMAFTLLVEPVHRLTSEIAAESIRHNLSEGRGMNERTYNGIGELRQVAPEPQSPFFPKTRVPSPNEMLANESRKTGPSSLASPTPQYLRTRKETSPLVSGKHQSDSRHNPKDDSAPTGSRGVF